MGADANAKQSICTKTEALLTSKSLSVDTEMLQKEDSTIPIAKAMELVNTFSELHSHEEELKKCREVGSQIPVIMNSEIGTDPNYKFTFVWFNTIGFIILHIIGITGLIAALLGYCRVYTSIYSLWLIYAAGQGVTMGAHRLWSHRAFKAKRWLKIFLLYMHTLAGQNCLWVWVRDHRQHHKYSDTDADPHNANRGFWFSHVGWLCVRKHPKVIEYGKKIDMSDLDADPYIMFQKNHYKLLYTIFALGLPTLVPIYAWNENKWMALWVAYFTRTIINLNVTWLVNSAAHLFGTRPFDKTIYPVESWFVAALAAGEGWHNYHHAFPWDYRAAELGSPLNLTCTFIDFLAKYGIIYDRREATANMVKNRCLRTGDMSHQKYGNPEFAPEIKTLWNTYKHPLNPSYTSAYCPEVKTLPAKGYALVEEELASRELDEEILSKENEILEKVMATDENQNSFKDPNNNASSVIKRNKNSLNIVNGIELPPSNNCGLAVSEVIYKSD
ncbi:hypothetical protein PVAND_000153 [Polypedilum vanderplanki]|uniref:Fatty acid desaturase domain-containing protein n=1 Tax=Polypedilum vanderplanki TaxID=319348 RepID=A0A9J6BKF7_POLVA|nr:hypothetical protein PVAND_000153 [Polypedilum vanderplanki]